jgi:hypothetical protein
MRRAGGARKGERDANVAMELYLACPHPPWRRISARQPGVYTGARAGETGGRNVDWRNALTLVLKIVPAASPRDQRLTPPGPQAKLSRGLSPTSVANWKPVGAACVTATVQIDRSLGGPERPACGQVGAWEKAAYHPITCSRERAFSMDRCFSSSRSLARFFATAPTIRTLGAGSEGL